MTRRMRWIHPHSDPDSMPRSIDAIDLAKLVKQRGVTVEEPRVSSAESLIANVAGPSGVRIELSEITPESLQRKAIDSCK